MPDDLTHADRVRILVDDPNKYEELVADYDDEVDFYHKARAAAPTALEEFEKYLSLYRIFINRGPTRFVYSQLERNSIRSIKNMILRDSESGQQYPVRTLSEVYERVKVYQDLGVNSVSLQSVIENTIEHIYADRSHRNHAYAILTTLLSDVPNSTPDTVEFLARARLIEGLLEGEQTESQFDSELEAYASIISDPRPEDDRTAEELYEEASSRPYSDSEIVELYSAAFFRNRSRMLLFDYLYFSGRDVIERNRHSSRESPSLGELHVAKHQFAVLKNQEVDWEGEKKAYLCSYFHTAEALIDSGGHWQTGRDPRNAPEVNFKVAAEEYLAAALGIQGINDERYVKYLSKALRQAANGVDSWAAKKELHGCALVLMHEELQKDGPEETIQGTITKHRYWKTEAAAYVAFQRGDPEVAYDRTVDAEELVEDIPQSDIGSYWLDQIRKLSEGKILESENEFAEAADRYESFNRESELTNTRKALAQIKHHISNGNHNDALRFAEGTFGEDSLVVITLRALTDEQITKKDCRKAIPQELLADRTSVEQRLQSILRLYCECDSFRDRLKPFLSATLKEL